MVKIHVAVLDNGGAPGQRLVEALASAEQIEVVTKRPSLDALLEIKSDPGVDGVLIGRELAATLGERLRATNGGAVSAQRRPSTPSPLTARESEVLGMLSEGKHVGRIARELAISVHTVRGHVKKILGKINAHSQLEAVVKAARSGWLPDRRLSDAS